MQEEESPALDTPKKNSKPKPSKKRADDSGLPPSNESYMSEIHSRFGPFTPLSPLAPLSPLTDDHKTEVDPGFFGEEEDRQDSLNDDYLCYMAEEDV